MNPLAEFIARAHAAGAGDAILAWQEEHALEPLPPTDDGRTPARCAPVRRLRLLAYGRGGELIAIDADGHDRAAAAAAIAAAGLRVHERCRNTADWRGGR